jgi:hypothetical protein
MSVSLQASRAALITGWLFSGSAALAQGSPAWLDPPSRLDTITTPEPPASLRSVQPPRQTAGESSRNAMRAQAARDLAFNYLNLWSAPNRVTLAEASSFYGSTLRFHGQQRTLGSVVAEKRRFTERWPERTYRYRPETTMVGCETSGERCTVWILFDYLAANPRQGRRSLGIGDHEIVVSFSSGRPVIVAENSRVLRRGMARFSAASRSLTP